MLVKMDANVAGGGVQDKVVECSSLGAYLTTQVTVEDLQNYKYIRTMTQSEYNDYMGLTSSGISVTSVTLSLINASATTQHTYTVTTTPTEVANIDVSNAVVASFSNVGSTGASQSFAIYFYN